MDIDQNHIYTVADASCFRVKDIKKLIRIFVASLLMLLFVAICPFEIANNHFSCHPLKTRQRPRSYNRAISLSYTCAGEHVTKLVDAAESKIPVITVHREKVIEKIEHEEPEPQEPVQEEVYVYSGEHLTAPKGTIEGPSGKETWYNLKMSGVVSNMRRLGFDETNYPYWVRDDGVKMLGDYVMVAADLGIRPKGTVLESSLGMAIVCDTGEFAKSNQTQIDIATNW